MTAYKQTQTLIENCGLYSHAIARTTGYMGWVGVVVKDLASMCSPPCHLDVVTFVKFQRQKSPLSIL